MDFLTLPTSPFTLQNVTVPACAVGQEGDLLRCDLHVADDRFTDTPGPPVDVKGAMALPAFVDAHTHLDKGHIWPRASNPDGTFMDAGDPHTSGFHGRAVRHKLAGFGGPAQHMGRAGGVADGEPSHLRAV